MGKGCFWDSLTRIVACYGFYVKGERAFLGVDVFCDVCCKTFWVKTFHPNLIDYFRGVSLIGSGFVGVVRVLKVFIYATKIWKEGNVSLRLSIIFWWLNGSFTSSLFDCFCVFPLSFCFWPELLVCAHGFFFPFLFRMVCLTTLAWVVGFARKKAHRNNWVCEMERKKHGPKPVASAASLASASEYIYIYCYHCYN